MKELDAVGDALEGLLGLEGWRGGEEEVVVEQEGGGIRGSVHPGPGETDAAMEMSVQGVLYWLS